MPTLILRGTATVSFVKIIRDMDADEANELLGNTDLQEFQIDIDDCQELVQVDNIEAEVR